jgi:SAM-dependent methyltransferase
MASNSRKQLEDFLKTLDVTGRVMDIGGAQNPVKGRTHSFNSDTYLITDLEVPHIEKKKADFTLDLNEKVRFFPKYWGSFDFVFCLEVFEYLWNPAQALDTINKLLKKDGKAIISFHWTYGLHNPKGEDCLRYTKNWVLKVAGNFSEIEFYKRPHTDEGNRLLNAFYRAEGMRLDYTDKETFDGGFIAVLTK